MDLKSKFISKLQSDCNKLKSQNRHGPIQLFLIDTIKRCKLFFNKCSNDIIITRADKGSVNVIMNKIDYTNKVNLMLEDETTYKKLKKDPTFSIQNSVNKFARKLKSYIKRSIQ